MKKWLNVLRIDLATLLLGSMLSFAFAPYEIFPLAIISIAGLQYLTLHTSRKRSFWLGFVFGVGLFSTGVYWVFISIHTFGDVPNFLAGLITAALIGFLALFPAIACYATQRYFPKHTTGKTLYAFPAIWVLSEWLRSIIFTGFPWLLLGYSQTNSPLKGFAPILSVYGVSLAVVITSSLIVNTLLCYRQKEFRSMYFSLFAIVTIWITGGLLSFIPWTKPIGNPISVSLVQGNIPQSVKWSPEHLQLSLDTYSTLTEPLWGKNKLIIWPEAAIPMTLQSAAEFIETLDKKALKTNSHLMLGIPVKNPNGEGYFNAVVSLGADKTTYLKRRLVPFGEYIPLQNIFSNLFDFMKVPVPDLISGASNQKTSEIGGVKILTSICYEIAFPELINSNDRTIGMLLTVTNDAWFGDSSAQAQHLQMAAMRAIELRRPLLFVSNDGITAIVNPDGRVESSAPTHQTFVLNGIIQPTIGLTPWMKNGTDPIFFIVICLLFAAWRQSRTTTDSPNSKNIMTNKI